MAKEFKYLAIKNWHKFQPTEKLRKQNAKLPWIRTYTAQIDDCDYARLSIFERGVIHACREVRGRTGRNIPNDCIYIARAIRALPKEAHCIPQAIRKLIAFGFLVPTNQQDDPREGEGIQKPSTDVELETESKPKEGKKEGRKEGASFASLTTPDGVPSESDQDCKHDGGKLTCYQWLTTRWSDKDTAEQVVHQIMSLWHDLTNNWNNDPETEEAIARAVQHQDNALTISHTIQGVLVTYADKFKSHGQPIAWRDLKFFLEPNRYDLNARKVRALDAARAAKAESAPTKPVLHNSPRSGYFSIGRDSVCCDCGAKGQNVTGRPRCQPCVDKFVAAAAAPSPQGEAVGDNMDFEAEAV